MGLEALLQMGAKKIPIQSDSQFEYRVNDRSSKCFSRAMELLRQFASIRLCSRQAKVDQAIAPHNLMLSRGGKSGLHRTGWPLTAAPSDRGKVPQKIYRPPSVAGKVEKAR
jgi:hypothetical protein